MGAVFFLGWSLGGAWGGNFSSFLPAFMTVGLLASASCVRTLVTRKRRRRRSFGFRVSSTHGVTGALSTFTGASKKQLLVNIGSGKGVTNMHSRRRGCVVRTTTRLCYVPRIRCAVRACVIRNQRMLMIAVRRAPRGPMCTGSRGKGPLTCLHVGSRGVLTAPVRLHM